MMIKFKHVLLGFIALLGIGQLSGGAYATISELSLKGSSGIFRPQFKFLAPVQGLLSYKTHQAHYAYDLIKIDKHPTKIFLGEFFYLNNDGQNFNFQNNLNLPAFYLTPFMVGKLLARLALWHHQPQQEKTPLHQTQMIDGLTKELLGAISPALTDSEKQTVKKYFTPPMIKRMIKRILEVLNQKNLNAEYGLGENFPFQILSDFFIRKFSGGKKDVVQLVEGMKSIAGSATIFQAPTAWEKEEFSGADLINLRGAQEEIDFHPLIKKLRNEDQQLMVIKALEDYTVFPFLTLQIPASSCGSTKLQFSDCVETSIRNLLGKFLHNCLKQWVHMLLATGEENFCVF